MHVGRPCYEDPSKNEREVLFVLAHRIKKFCSNIRPCYTAIRPLMAGQPQCELFSQGLFLWHGSVKRQQGVGHRLLIVLKEQPHKLLWVFWVGLLSQRSSTCFFFWLRPDVLFWPPVHGCQRFQPEHSLLRQTKPTFTWKIITFKVSSAQVKRRHIKSCVQPETLPPGFFVGSVPYTPPPELGQNWTESSTVACAIMELFCPHKQNCSSPSTPICSPASHVLKGEFELKCCHFDSLDVIQHTLQTGTCKWSDRDFQSAIQA